MYQKHQGKWKSDNNAYLKTLGSSKLKTIQSV